MTPIIYGDELSSQIMPDYDTLQNLEYLDLVFSESLRLYPPAYRYVTRYLLRKTRATVALSFLVLEWSQYLCVSGLVASVTRLARSTEFTFQEVWWCLSRRLHCTETPSTGSSQRSLCLRGKQSNINIKILALGITRDCFCLCGVLLALVTFSTIFFSHCINFVWSFAYHITVPNSGHQALHPFAILEGWHR